MRLDNPGMTAPTPAGEDDRAAYVRALIASRCPELGPSDLAMLAEADPHALPGSIGVQIMEVLERMADRMDAFERVVRERA
jgi:hypothetical protein